MSQKVTNNKFFGSPAIMADGRFGTEYRPSGQVEEQYMNNSGTTNHAMYRKWLQNNALNIIDKEHRKLDSMYSSRDCNWIEVPIQSMCIVDNTGSRCETIDMNGLGRAYKGVYHNFKGRNMPINERNTLGKPELAREAQRSLERFTNPSKNMKVVFQR